jgi:hypothetical protein
MSQCKYCNDEGIFLRVNSAGLCSSCAGTVGFTIARLGQIVSESIDIANRSKVLSTRTSRLDLAIEKLEELQQYAARGICYKPEDITAQVGNLRAFRKSLVTMAILDAARTALEQARLATTPKQRVTLLTKAAMKAQLLSKELPMPSDAQEVLTSLDREICNVTIAGHIADAEKAAFRGQKKKAVDRYQEALYALKTDRVPDDEQLEQIRDIEAKLTALQAADA